MNSPDSYYVGLFNNILMNLYRYVAIPLYILGNLGNLLNALVFFRKTWKKNVCVFYFLIYILIDSIYLNSIILGSIFMYGFNINLQNSNVILCKIFSYLRFLFAILSPTITILASIDRLLISSQNVETRLYSSRRLAYFSISISTFFWVIFFFHALIKYNIQRMSPLISICLYNLTDFYSNFISYSMLSINVILVLTMIILSILSFKNVRRIRSIPRQQRKNIRSMHKKDFQLLRCLYAHGIVYIIVSAFLAANTIYKTITQYQIQTSWKSNLDNFLFNFGMFLLQIHYCIKFFIYITVSKAFRQELKRIVYKLYGNDRPPIREEEQNEQELNQNNVEVNRIHTSNVTF